MTTSQAVPYTVSVPPVLAAVDRYGLLPLLPEAAALALAGPVALAVAEVPLDPGTATSVARQLAAVAAIIDPALEQAGSELRVPAPPQAVAPKTSGATVRPPVLRLGADGRIKVEQTPYALLQVCRSLPGARSVKRGGRHAWWSIPASPMAAHAAIEALTPFGVIYSNGVRELADQVGQAASARARFVDGGVIPDADGTDVVNMKLWDHQRVAVGYAEEASALLLAIPMSGGKTAIAIAAINRRQAARVLIVCPNKVRGVWPREVRERSQVGWHIEDGTRPACRGKGRIDLATRERRERCERVLFDCDCPAPVHAFVINYEVLALPGWRDWVPPHMIDAIIYDEIHRLKSPTGSVSKAAARLVSYSRFRMGLSGTPAPQYWFDIFGVFRALDPGIFGEVWTHFKRQWVRMLQTRDGREFPDPRHSTDDAALAEKFNSITYRPIVDLDLPPVTDTTREVDLEPAARKVYDELASQLWADLTEFLEREARQREAQEMPDAATWAAGDAAEEALPWDVDDPDVELASPGADGAVEITANLVLTRMLRLAQITGGTLISDPERDEDGRVIAPGRAVRVSQAKAELLAEELEQAGCTKAAFARGAGEPVVVFCRFKADLDAVREVADKAGLVYGEISGRRSDGLNSDSRMAGHVQVCGVQIQAGGTGIDLTRARVGVWYSIGYSVSDYDQARARLVRVNQSRPVAFVHLLCPDTVDPTIYDAIDDRRSAIGAVLREHGIDPSRLGVPEVVPGARLDSPHAVTVVEPVSVPWD
jgi:superfamily II DNA or RNA helicase